MNQDIEKLIVKFLLKEISFDEQQQLELWITNPKNEALFLEYIKTNASIHQVMNQYDEKKAKDKILHRIRKEQKPIPINKTTRIKYAAAILIIALVSTYFLRNTLFSTQSEVNTPIIVNNQIEPGYDKATLVLETGEIVTLEKGSQFQTQNAISNGEEITYVNTASKELAYNYLTIPRGGQFQLTLSDGTRVWLNSETQLKYPVSFVEGESRKVELVYGEAYFEVSHSTEHQGADFIVMHDQQEIQVLGTEFNIKAYKDENSIFTTLAKGKVAVHYHGLTKYLIPGQQSNVDNITKTMSVYNVNVKTQIAWKYGLFDFENMPLKEIMKVLSRWYDFDVVFENKSLETVKFKGILSKNQSIEEILSAIKSISINNYEINNKTIKLR
ncbi:FecR family protein [Tenacibaculum sp.]|uniref:FecR family protein n=1 Tax=Tenacibaculum sp. TaxID=1906242 RepID=UPI003D12BE23